MTVMVDIPSSMVQKMAKCPFSRMRAAALAGLALGLAAAPASAQDSFVRVTDPGSGRPVLSVLGSGLGMDYAALVLEMGCPSGPAWTVEVAGLQAPQGSPVAFGFSDGAGRWAEVPPASVAFGEDRVSVRLDRAAFRAALARARAAEPGAAAAEARIVIGEQIGVAVNREALVREMTAFARDCALAAGDPPGPAAERAPGPQAARR
jgi:hypothetical protein